MTVVVVAAIDGDRPVFGISSVRVNTVLLIIIVAVHSDTLITTTVVEAVVFRAQVGLRKDGRRLLMRSLNMVGVPLAKTIIIIIIIMIIMTARGDFPYSEGIQVESTIDTTIIVIVPRDDYK